VKTKVVELLYSWTVALPEESKIKDAYYMLKRQGRKQCIHAFPPACALSENVTKYTASNYTASGQAL